MNDGPVAAIRWPRRPRTWAAAVLGLVLTASPAWAVFPGGNGGGGGGGGGGTGGGGSGGQVPEINPGGAGAALALLAGVTLIAWDRRGRVASPAPSPTISG